MAVSENAARGQAGLIFRRQGELIEAVRRRLAWGEEVERKYRWAACNEARRCNDFVASEGANNDVGTFLRGTGHGVRYAGITGVVDCNWLSLRFRCLVIRSHEAITNGGGRHRLAAGDRKEQRNMSARVA